jgi:N-acetyl sugar amidotransferase
MDTSDPHIVFDKNGFCNHCTNALNRLYRRDKTRDKLILNEKIKRIKENGKSFKYDCIIGLSGGVDSTFLAFLVKVKYGLRPLAVHLDNGWNSKQAVKNIKSIVKKLDIDLHTHVIDWEEFKQIQLAYLKSSVLNLEVPTDHAITASLFNLANDNNIKFILSGFNPYTEGILPKSWSFNTNDLRNLIHIVSSFSSNIKIKTFPTLGEKRFKELKKRIEIIDIYEFEEFNLSHALEVIQKELSWIPYGNKHYESVWTRFYQGFILPQKYKIDKRRAHLSNQICLGEKTREEAISEINHNPYDINLLSEDKEYVLKKFNLSPQEFNEIINSKVISHFHYKTDLKSFLLKRIMIPTNPIYKIYKKIIKKHNFGRDF